MQSFRNRVTEAGGKIAIRHLDDTDQLTWYLSSILDASWASDTMKVSLLRAAALIPLDQGRADFAFEIYQQTKNDIAAPQSLLCFLLDENHADVLLRQSIETYSEQGANACSLTDLWVCASVGNQENIPLFEALLSSIQAHGHDRDKAELDYFNTAIRALNLLRARASGLALSGWITDQFRSRNGIASVELFWAFGQLIQENRRLSRDTIEELRGIAALRVVNSGVDADKKNGLLTILLRDFKAQAIEAGVLDSNEWPDVGELPRVEH